VTRPQLAGLAIDRLDGRERDPVVRVPPVQARAVDSGWRFRPQSHQGHVVLRDQLPAMNQHEDAHGRVGLGQVPHHLGDDHGLAEAGGHVHEGVATPLAPVVHDRINAGLLVWAKADHGTTSMMARPISSGICGTTALPSPLSLAARAGTPVATRGVSSGSASQPSWARSSLGEIPSTTRPIGDLAGRIPR
jgi:hypothetical protein